MSHALLRVQRYVVQDAASDPYATWQMGIQDGTCLQAPGDEVDDDELNTCRALCRIFTETAEACMDIFLLVGPINVCLG